MKHKTKPLSRKSREKIARLKRSHHHPFIHHIHKKHKISYKTLMYMKEYGPKSHVYNVIIKESIKILILASIISSIGGTGLESINNKVFTILPLLILLPALNDMTGDFGTIVSSKFTTMLYLRKVGGKWWKSKDVHILFFTILIMAIISAVFIGLLSSGIAYLRGFSIDLILLLKVIQVSLISTVVLVGIIFTLSVTVGLYIYKKNEDPNNFLIPITTSVGDLGSMAMFSFMVYLFF